VPAAPIERVLAAVRAAVRWTSLALLAALVVTPLTQIILRGAFSLPLAGAEELTRYFLIAFTFIAAVYVSEQGGQIRMEEFQAWLPPTPRWWLQLAIEGAGAAMFACLCVASVVTVSKNLDNKTATLELPFPVLFAPIVIGSALLCLESLVHFVRLWRHHRPEAKQTTLA
jgi:TRAP-type C4-dicarboxylate transport system permease small subunit